MIERAMGEVFPISFATAIALENLKDYKQIKRYNALYVNLRTLIRNAYGCIDKDDITAKELSEAVIEDINTMGQIIDNHFDHLSLIIYLTTNKSLKKEFRYSELYKPKSAKQIKYHEVLEEAVKLIKEKYKSSITEYDVKITPDIYANTAIILTSYCIDLLSARLFKHLTLVESHTGAIKGSLEWNTKLTNGSKLHNMPFCKFTIAVFGDNNRSIVALPKEFREAIKYLAEKGKWTARSSINLIRYTISNYADPHSKSQLLKLL